MSEIPHALPLHAHATALAAPCHVVIPCAGSGSRAGLSSPKQYEVLAGRRLIDHTVAAFLLVERVVSVTVVVAPDDEVYQSSHPRVSVLRKGGATRAHSVFNGLANLLASGVPQTDWVLVHDAARCLVTSAQINALVNACESSGLGGLLALPLPDTLKVAAVREGQPRVSATLDRSDKWLAQTPQMFRLCDLHRALAQAEPNGFTGITDEASAMEAQGFEPLLVQGSAHNFKVTYPDDFALAEAVLLQRHATSQSTTVTHS